LVLSLALTFALTSVTALAQEGRLVREKVHGSSLEKTVTGENPDRSVTVYLPPSYLSDQARRFPVVYLLHGYGGREGVVRPKQDTNSQNRSHA
jgi:predicted dienelactone hydrolase